MAVIKVPAGMAHVAAHMYMCVEVHVAMPGPRASFALMVAAPSLFGLRPPEVPIRETSCAIIVSMMVMYDHYCLLVNNFGGCWHRYRDLLHDDVRLARSRHLNIFVSLHLVVVVARRAGNLDLDRLGGHRVRYILGDSDLVILGRLHVDILWHQLHVGHCDILVVVHHFHFTGPSAQVAAEALLTGRPLVTPIIEITIAIIRALSRLHNFVLHNMRYRIGLLDVDFVRNPVDASHIVYLGYGVDCWLRRGRFFMMGSTTDVHLVTAVGLLP